MVETLAVTLIVADSLFVAVLDGVPVTVRVLDSEIVMVAETVAVSEGAALELAVRESDTVAL